MTIDAELHLTPAGEDPQSRHRDLLPYLPHLLVEWQRDCAPEAFREVEGTLAFVDLSGFTSMSERLARIGKAGSEEVAYVINSTFSQLLAIAWDQGGGLIKFGGDALLLFFSDTDHAMRACRSALEMRQALRTQGRLQTAAGGVLLRMSAGVHSGRFHFFLAGESHRELIVTGPGASRTAAAESAASAGEVLVTAETGALLPRAMLGAARDAGYLLKRRGGHPAAPAALAPAEDPGDLQNFLPVALRRFVARGDSEGEHRQVAVAFLHFGGVDRILDRSGPGEVHVRLEALVRGVQAAADEHEVCFLGTDIAPDGGKIILIAGAPVSHENDEERMLRTLRRALDGDYGLPVCAGVNRGRVFAGEIGPEFRRTYTVMGDAVNLAARLMQKAIPGQALTTAGVLEQSKTVFEVAPLEPFVVKGKARPVQAFALGPITGTAHREQRALPIAGREREIQALQRALDSARAGNGTLVEISGEAGIGKSRLLAELEVASRDLVYVRASCEQYESSTAYFAARQVLRSLISLHGGDEAWQSAEAFFAFVHSEAIELAPWLPLLALPLDLQVDETRESRSLDPRFRTARLHKAVTELIDKLMPGPAVIAVEDVHWMDEVSAALFMHIAEALASRPWLLCVTRRPAESGFVPPPDLQSLPINLEPLSQDASLVLATAALEEQPLPEHQVALLARRAGGNPLFLQQLLAARASSEQEALPESVEGAVAAEIDRLSVEDRRLLRYASVIGPSFSLGLLYRLLPDPGPPGDAAPMARLSRFVREEAHEVFTFKHALFRDAAYEGLPFRRRRELHGRVGEALEQQAASSSEELAELLSLHFHRAQRYGEAWRYSLLAGDRARSKFANVDAATFYRRSLDAAPRCGSARPAEVLRVFEALGDVLELAGLYGEAKEAYRQGRRQAGVRSPASTRFILKEGVVCDRLGQYTQALRWYGRGLRSLGEGEQDRDAVYKRVQLRLCSAAARYRQGRYRECVRWCHSVLADAGHIGDKASLARGYYLLDAAYTDLGSPESAKYRALALPIYEELGDLIGQANVLNNLGIDAYYEGRWDEALEMYERSKQARESAGDVVGAATATNNIGEILSDQGQLEEAERLFSEALRVWRAARYSVGVAIATSNLGRAAARAGRLDEAVQRLQEALASFEKLGAETLALETRARLAEESIMSGRHQEALPRLEQALSEAKHMGGMTVLCAMLHRLRGVALTESGDHETGWRCWEESARLARSVNAGYELGQTLVMMAQYSDDNGRTGAGEFDLEGKAMLASLGVVSAR